MAYVAATLRFRARYRRGAGAAREDRLTAVFNSRRSREPRSETVLKGEASLTETVGIIGGGGWLGGAIAEQGLAAAVLSPSSLVISGRSPRGERFARWPNLGWTSDNAELARRSGIVILPVRPENFGDLHIDLQGKLVISVMAGVSMATVRRKMSSDRIVRTMPNAAAAIGRSYTPWVASPEVTAEDRAFVTALFSACGEQDEVE